ncbi:DUF3108 domain-containing protein [Galbibacter pacificus]|uniref:DUF3108 domain-containing protein n=1 Tax=Galbibacter pacificus TaxID=2996052 RepID=A0ABT6FTP3_9FLAO|nr:DUF3108 domain-containing protein [Galbibacter pacificus]MDG3583134.1 DUF3108 domain-containing protein [Galbibacter pacificus]MDG3586615.1 DUF3108 domain-containing protein [Galbibacter pacificus]
MKKILLTLLIFWLSAFTNQSQPIKTNSSYKGGEWFQFRIHYGIFNASFATLELKEESLNGKEVYHVVGNGQTTGLASLFFKVDDNYESYFDKQTGQPYKFIRKIDEGGHTKDLEINFDYKTNKAVLEDHKHDTEKSFKIEEGIQDLLSAFYYLRDRVDINNINKGDEYVSDMLFDDDGIFKFKLKYLGRETLNTKFGKVRCLKFRPFVQSGRIFKEEESLTLWVSDDDNKMPIRVKADILVGSIKADLEAFKGLKHQFKIHMN